MLKVCTAAAALARTFSPTHAAFAACGREAAEQKEDLCEVVTEVRDNRYALSSIELTQKAGLRIVHGLKCTTPAQSVTAARRERKAAVPELAVQHLFQELEHAGLRASLRNAAGKAHRAQATLTYYGVAAKFDNHQERSTIRLRLRFFISYERDAAGNIVDATRENPTVNAGYLEIKIKAPRPDEESSVDKHRIIMADALLARLVNLDPASHHFDRDLQIIFAAAKGDKAAAKDMGAAGIDAMRATIGQLSKVRLGFLRPRLVIIYERTGYCYRDPAERNVEFQMTVDRRVRAHFPLLPSVRSSTMPVLAHLAQTRKTEFAHYADGICVLELKEPQMIARRLPSSQTPVHRLLVNAVVHNAMQRHCRMGDFDAQSGKAGHFRRRIQQEHDVCLTRNQDIPLHFPH